jgi:bifunctional UDP-N-acetylglucosamine pyrophosphorylase/glucosamine-1-phosphate N-acetyltransferase
MMMKGVILAAGKGTRLEPLTYSIPKEMIHVCGRPLLQHAIDMFKAGGVENIIVIVGNNKAAVFDYLKDGKWTGVDVSYRFQTELDGVAKAIHAAKPLIDDGEVFAVTFGDEIIEPKDKIINEMRSVIKKTGAKCVIGLSPVSDPERYGIGKINEDGKVLEIFEKPSTKEDLERLKSNGKYLGANGVYLFHPDVFKYIEKTPRGAKNEFQISDTIKLMLKDGLLCYAYVHDGIYRDVGTHEALLATEKELLNNVIKGI